jgi:gluconokinase/shikimate kinase
MLAHRLRWPFQEGDDLHPESNIEKMRAGHPLSDQDRTPWLELIADWVDKRLDAGQNGIITCSALKRAYRDVINRRHQGVVFIFLDGSWKTVAPRLASRPGHFMPPLLLKSQFEDLERLAPDEPAIRFDVDAPPQRIVDAVIEKLGLRDPTLLE